jgi:sugar-specific transcriptional regulator TrmB
MENDQLKERLEKAGLSNNEAVIYGYLLTTGGAYPSAIAEATGINRSTTYKTLLQMSVKNLVNEIERGGKLFYQTTGPRALSNHARSQVRLAEQKYDVAENLLGTIEKLIGSASRQPQILTFEGPEGILHIYEDHISQPKPYEMLAISNADRLYSILPKTFFDNYRRTKEKQKTITRGILPDTKENRGFVGRAYVEFGIEKKYWPETKFVNPKLFSSEAEITIYGEKRVSIVKLTKDNSIGIIIDDETIYGMMKMMFELIWKGGAKN